MPFEFDGRKYKKASSHQKEWGNRIISELSLQGHENILDLGCGDGVLTERLAKLVPRGKVLGVDSSLGMLVEARRLQTENLDFVQADINRLNLNQKFDLIFSNAALHWVTDHKNLIERLLSLLVSGGEVRLNFASSGNSSNFFEAVQQEILEPQYKEYFKDFVWPWYMPTIREYEGLMHRFEVRELEIWEENLDRYFPDKNAIISWIDQPSIVPFLYCIDDEKEKLGFRDKVVEKVVQRTLQSDGRCFETFRRINVKFRKN